MSYKSGDVELHELAVCVCLRLSASVCVYLSSIHTRQRRVVGQLRVFSELEEIQCEQHAESDDAMRKLNESLKYRVQYLVSELKIVFILLLSGAFDIRNYRKL